MHCDDELGHVEGTLAFSIRETPDSAEDLIGEACALEDGLRRFTWETDVSESKMTE